MDAQPGPGELQEPQLGDHGRGRDTAPSPRSSCVGLRPFSALTFVSWFLRSEKTCAFSVEWGARGTRPGWPRGGGELTFMQSFHTAKESCQGKGVLRASPTGGLCQGASSMCTPVVPTHPLAPLRTPQKASFIPIPAP